MLSSSKSLLFDLLTFFFNLFDLVSCYVFFHHDKAVMEKGIKLISIFFVVILSHGAALLDHEKA